MSHPIGVIVMAYGGPNKLDDIPGYLADIRTGRVTTQETLNAITHSYTRIGGRSPLLQNSTAQCDAIRQHLDPERFTVYLGMRHWFPWIEDTIRTMLDDGITRGISLALAPHFSSLSTTRYQHKIKAGLDMHRGEIAFKHIDSYYKAPGFITALCNRVKEGLERWPEDERNTVHIVFSAHSLPSRIIEMGDPYDTQILATAHCIAEQLGLRDQQWSRCYQSAGRSPEPWLGPDLTDYIPELAKQGIQNMLSVPIGFVSDHIETLFDIDIEAQAIASTCGMHLERTLALHTDPTFTKQLADLIVEKADAQGWA